jgi:SSS family solute:Na+ symporter
LTLGVMLITSGHITGMVITLLLIIGVGIYAGSRVKTEADFSGSARKASAALVAGTIMGTLVGGASTIGTAQLAFNFGVSAWWFTLGAGIGCIVLGLGMLKPLYTSNKQTIPQYLVATYGESIGPICSIFTSIGMFLNVIGQGIAAVALLTSAFHLNSTLALIISVVLVIAYVLVGGFEGTGLVGMIKLMLIYITIIVTSLIAYNMFGGFNGILNGYPDRFPWFSLFGRGFSVDAAAAFSLIVGVISTQTYIQAVLSAKSISHARLGALLSAILIPPVGVGGILVGLYMRAHSADFPGLQSSEVLPTFILHYIPPVAGGVIMATLLIAVIGTWAGLNLGISTMLTRDIYKRFINPNADDKKALICQRIIILTLCILSIIVVNSNAGSLILGFSFLSMGLRGCTVLFPLLGAMFFRKYVTPIAGLTATFLGPFINFVWHFIYPQGIDPLYPGLLASCLTLIIISTITRSVR